MYGAFGLLKEIDNEKSPPMRFIIIIYLCACISSIHTKVKWGGGVFIYSRFFFSGPVNCVQKANIKFVFTSEFAVAVWSSKPMRRIARRGKPLKGKNLAEYHDRWLT